MRAAKVQASLRIRAVSPEPSLLAHTSSESRGTFRQKARSLAPLNGWACAVKVCHDGMLEDTNSLDGAHIIFIISSFSMNSTWNFEINKDFFFYSLLECVMYILVYHCNNLIFINYLDISKVSFWMLRKNKSFDRLTTFVCPTQRFCHFIFFSSLPTATFSNISCKPTDKNTLA